MKEFKASTKTGKRILERINTNIGYRLWDVYKVYSDEKKRAYSRCFEKFLHTQESHDFRICSANTFGYTVGWFGKINDEPVAMMETKDNSYIVWLNR